MSTFNHSPEVAITHTGEQAVSGWTDIGRKLNDAVAKLPGKKKVIVVECYPGVHDEEIRDSLVTQLKPDIIIEAADALKDEEAIRRMTKPDVTDDRVFGYMTRLNMDDFFDGLKLETTRQGVESVDEGTILITGTGAALLSPHPDLLVYADMPRWEIQLRMRNNEVSNLGISNAEEAFELQYKRGFFVDWRVSDRHKKKWMHDFDYVLDTTHRDRPVMITGDLFHRAMQDAVSRPFSLVPYYDPGPWGGQWMKNVLDLDPSAENYAWCFNCVPEENSLLFNFDGIRFETPAINLVFNRPVELLGDAVHARFGDEFPIRFDFLDTINGGNLSLQVHPLTGYIREKFGLQYTQDESYYILDAREDATVYLGFREDVDARAMVGDLRASEKYGKFFDAEKYVEKWPAAKHDHFLIPGGTIHCSGRNSMVLEISSTPYIFTFKLWDWGRVGLNGEPRPINIEHGICNLQWDRKTSWTRENLINRVEKVAEGDGWVEEKTGLHEREFIETRRHWFTGTVAHDTGGLVNVLNLVEGDEVVVESPGGHFEPFVVHYAETFVVPAAVGGYTIRPHGDSEGRRCATIKAYVRTKG